MIKREKYLKKLEKLKDKDYIKILMGIRRSGKTTLLKTYIKELEKKGINKNNIIFISFESRKYNTIKNFKELDQIIYKQIKNTEGKIYLFFDEIQYVDQWEKSINGYRVDLDCDIYITGSNSSLLASDLATTLTGRYIVINIYPFSFKETLQYKKEIEKIKLTPTKEKEIYKEYFKFGGMPGLLKLDEENKLESLNTIYDTIMLRDIIDKYEIKKNDLFNRFTYYLMSTPGETFSSTSIANFFKSQNRRVSTDTILRYATYLTESYFLSKARRNDLKGKNLLKTLEKYYLTDHGFHQAIVKDNKDNITGILENIVYIELLRRDYKVTIGKIYDKEIDFICEKNNKTIYIQVSYTIAEINTREREMKPFSLIDNDNDRYIISTDDEDYSRRYVKHLNIIDFLKSDI